MNKTGVWLYIGNSSDPKPFDCDEHSLFYEVDNECLYELKQYTEKMSGWFKEQTLREVDYGEDVII